MIELCNKTNLFVIDRENLNDFLNDNKWLDKKDFSQICSRYGFPDIKITVVIEHYYIDAIYRDAYYNYWSKTHFDWQRYCKRLFLFHNEHTKEEFFSDSHAGALNSDFLGTIIIRPSYSSETDHTLGRTLLNPYKMISKSEDETTTTPFEYLETAEYKVHLLGNTYHTRAFPFLSQDGVVMRCAETAVCELLDFSAALSSRYANVLPSDIQKHLKTRLSERFLPSHGLYCNDISYLLGQFGFSPMIYVPSGTTARAQEGIDPETTSDAGVGIIAGDFDLKEAPTGSQWDENHSTDFKNWLHYYVESAIPVLAITAPRRDVAKHATLIIGHSKSQLSLTDCEMGKLGEFPCIDTANLYSNYIVHDDNQIPYVEEEMDKFGSNRASRLVAYIVPLEKHVFLEASSAISICDSFITQESTLLSKAIEELRTIYLNKAETSMDDEAEQYRYYHQAMCVTDENPLTIRYYLANSAEYKTHRIATSDDITSKEFYADVLMPKAVWVAEISTYKLYEQGYAFAEVVIDATASNMSKVNSIILLKVANLGVYRLPYESYNDFREKLEKVYSFTDDESYETYSENLRKEKCYLDLPSVFTQYSNFQKTSY